MEVDIRTLVLTTTGCPGLYDCPAIEWQDGVTGGPLVYLHKPKHVTQEDFDRIIKAMRISMVVEDEE